MLRSWPEKALSRLGLAAAIASGGWILPRPGPAPAQDTPIAGSVSTPASQPAEGQEEGRRVSEARQRLASGLIGGKHDFTEGGKSGRDLCLTCHTPHVLATPPPRLDNRATTTQPLRPYQAPGIELSGWSLLCLACHDGVTAPDVFSIAHAVGASDDLGGTAFSSRGLRSHPIGVEYPPSSNPKYQPLAAVEQSGLPLLNGRIQCTTCHDAHNTERHARMLRISDERSRLCLTCHRI